MRSEVDVINGLSNMLRANFPDIPIKDADVAEGFRRDCFSIAIMDMKDEMIGELKENSINIDIYYFCKDIYNGFLDLLNMKTKLLELLRKPVKISDSFFFTCDNLDFTVSQADKALAVNFDVWLIQDYEKEADYEYMEHLIIDETEV